MKVAELKEALSVRGYSVGKLKRQQLRDALRAALAESSPEGAGAMDVGDAADEASAKLAVRCGPSVPWLDLEESAGGAEGASGPPHGLFSTLDGREGVRRLPDDGERLEKVCELLELVAIDPGILKIVASVLCRLVSTLTREDAAEVLLKGVGNASDPTCASFDCSQESWVAQKHYNACRAYEGKRQRKNKE